MIGAKGQYTYTIPAYTVSTFVWWLYSVEFLSTGLFMPWGSDRVAENSQTFLRRNTSAMNYVRSSIKNREVARSQEGRRDNWQTVLTIILIIREQPYSVNARIFMVPVLCGEQGAESESGDLASEGS